jgi:hypothetical protein
MSWAQKTTGIKIKSKTQQGKQIIRNASLSLIKDWNTKTQGKNTIYVKR